MALVTILTPTYNRKRELADLFQSLQHQINTDFEWLIVDDGSDDGTRECVQQFKQEAQFPIRYIKKKNGGKHTALNTGVKQIVTPLTFIVDSDDQLLPRAVQEISNYYYKYKKQVNDKLVGAFSFLKGDKNSKPMVVSPEDEKIDSYIRVRIKENRPGDMAEVFVTDVLKEFPFPEFRGEKFLSEDVVWIQLGMKLKHVFINKIIYQCNYLTDGLTANDKRMKFASPLGSIMRGKMLMQKECGLIVCVKGAIIYNCYLREVDGDIPDCLKLQGVGQRILCFLLKPMGMYYNTIWKRGW